jgi:tRNA A-37 threonylcarbamoyl transferase component Bud32
MRTLSNEQLSTLTAEAKVLESDGLGPKVLRLNDGSFLKLFRKRRMLSTETLKPYARRFADNAATLKRLGFISPEIVQVYRLHGPVNRTAVHYQPLPGNTLRQVLADSTAQQRQQLILQFGELLALLHQRGVYFRSVHLGNVLVLPDGRLGLIDLADMRISRRALSLNKRQRNLKHMQRYAEDCQWLFVENRAQLQAGYARHASKQANEMLAAWQPNRA